MVVTKLQEFNILVNCVVVEGGSEWRVMGVCPPPSTGGYHGEHMGLSLMQWKCGH